MSDQKSGVFSSWLWTPDPNIERAGPAVAGMGVLEPNDVAAEFRQLQPVWHLTLEHAAFARVVAGHPTLARDHQNEFRTFRLCSAQKRKQLRIGRALGLAVKVDARIDRCGTAREALLEPPIKWLELRGGSCLGSRPARPRAPKTRLCRFPRPAPHRPPASSPPPR